MSTPCFQCPRRCGVDRGTTKGFCQSPSAFRIARAALHHWEEPSISGHAGSGTIFFSGCNLKCVFCQNMEVSRAKLGEVVTKSELADMMLRLQDEGAHNINLVTPSHYVEQLAALLTCVKPKLRIPIVYNSSGYDSADALRLLDGLVDIYLPDVKYHSSALSTQYSGAADYFTVAADALAEMLRQTGNPQIDDCGLMQRGTVVRHLILPSHRHDSIALLNARCDRFGNNAFLLSLMSQYTPCFAANADFPELHRRVTSFEYESVLREVERLGFDGYFQERTSASADFTPDFHERTF